MSSRAGVASAGGASEVGGAVRASTVATDITAAIRTTSAATTCQAARSAVNLPSSSFGITIRRCHRPSMPSARVISSFTITRVPYGVSHWSQSVMRMTAEASPEPIIRNTAKVASAE